MLSIRSTSFPLTSMSADSKSNAAPIDPADLTTFDEDGMGTSKYVKQTTQESERPDLGNARVVITGGRALKSAENFKMLEKLAEKLGAAVGATRAAVDAGYVPNDLQAQMNDASEVLGVIFDCLHRSFTSGFGVSDTESIESNVMGSWDCENSTYVAHSLFGMNVFESLNCYNCGMESKNMKYTSFFHNINASVLRTMKVICPESSFVSFSTLLK